MRLVSCQNNLRQIGVTQAQLQQSWPEPVAGAVPGARVAARGLPLASLFHEATPADAAPGDRALLAFPLGFGRGVIAPHQGFSQTVQGQNLLFLDGHVTFLAMGPAIDPRADDPSLGDDPMRSAWPSDRGGQPLGAGDVAPLVLVGRPQP
jgi:prepilin-type processing-associated H-X9-DG protein